jgi:uncharacterized Zn finger protein (UPF0148 family)
MFEDLIRELKRLERDSVALPVDVDADGYLDRECPNEECEFHFKIVVDDWANGLEGKQMYCPLCGNIAPADHFLTKEHREQARDQGLQYFSGRIGNAMIRDARRFNSRQPRSGLISMSLHYKGPSHIPALVPLEASEQMQLKITCDHCNARFAVIGSAFFCPKCGRSSVVRVFNDAMAKIEAKVRHLDRIVEAVATQDKDAAELTRRSLLESGISDAVVAFQRAMEELYRAHPSSQDKVNANAFQRLRDGSNLWQAVGCPSYADVLSSQELERMRILFQRRHLLAHSEGIVDDRYVQRSGDNRYASGQRIVVRPEHVEQLVALVRKLVSVYMPREEVS